MLANKPTGENPHATKRSTPSRPEGGSPERARNSLLKWETGKWKLEMREGKPMHLRLFPLSPDFFAPNHMPTPFFSRKKLLGHFLHELGVLTCRALFSEFCQGGPLIGHSRFHWIHTAGYLCGGCGTGCRLIIACVRSRVIRMRHLSGSGPTRRCCPEPGAMRPGPHQ